MDPAVARANAVRRLTWLVGLLLLWAVAIFAKLISIQVFHHDKYLADARRQQERKIVLPAVRGNIYDRNGHPLAMSVSSDSVSVNPLQVPDISFAAEILASNLKDVNREELYEKMKWQAENHKGFLVVKHHLSPLESERLRSLPVNWIDFTTETQRQYPNGEIAAHVLGGVYKQEEGAAGVEKAMDAVLRGRPGKLTVLTDVKRRGIDERVEVPALPGAAIQLTIDERIQFVAEREIREAVAKHHCRSGSVVVMNPYTGDIYALANFPTYDPNIGPKEGDDPMSRFDLGVSVPFEPGSVFKVITLAAALETTDLKPETLIHTGNGTLALPGRIVHDTKAHGTITFQEVLEQSSNIGAILIGQRVGRERMYDYVRRFGFGARSGVTLAAESSGILRKLDRWGTTSLASVSMGQEIGATSIQLARAAAVVANGGLLVKPRLVYKRDGKLEPIEQPVRILTPKTAITMRQLMEGVVISPHGTGHLCCRLDGYTSAGKTGSAQIFDSKTRHYTHTYNASFMGFSPVTNPQVVVMVTLNGTVGTAGFGGPSAGPVFNKVATEALRILDVPKDLPDSTPNKEFLLAAANLVDENDAAIAGLGDGPNILEDDPAASPQLLAQVNMTGPAVPDLRGKTVREVIQTASESGLPVSVVGSGIARLQFPAPGAKLMEGGSIKVTFRR